MGGPPYSSKFNKIVPGTPVIKLAAEIPQSSDFFALFKLMKILFISNFYPPHKIGGYELLCQQVVEAFIQRGHAAQVLTSTLGIKQPENENNVNRCLTLESDLDHYQVKRTLNYPAAKKRNIEYLHAQVSSFRPDIIFIWGMWALSKELALESEKLLNSRVVYYLANPWPIEKNLHAAYWELPPRRSYFRPLKQLLRIPVRLWLGSEWKRTPLKFQNAPCCSEALRNQLLSAGVPLNDSPVIYEGIDLPKYVSFGEQRKRYHGSGSLYLLYVGILAPHKGVHTILEALSRLAPVVQEKVTLTIVGTGLSEYESELHRLVESYGIQKIVTFCAPIPRVDLPEFLCRFDSLLLPSIWDEPLALIMQEALASGMAVIGTANGGTQEIIQDGQNGFLFPSSDATALAHTIEKILSDPSILKKVGLSGQLTAKKTFDFNRMVDELESLLVKVNSLA